MVDSMSAGGASIQSILNNIRQIRESFDQKNQVGMNVGVGSQGFADNTKQVSFQDTLQTAIKSVSDAQMESSKLKNAFEVGDPRVSLEQVTIASQQSSVQFEAMLQIRNKLVDAYKDIMNMPV